MMNILQAIEQNPPAASASKAAKLINVEANAIAKDENLTTTLSEIDRLISDVVVEKEVVATISDKGKKIDETSSEGANFDLWHLGGQQLSEEDTSELKEFAISCGYQQGQCSLAGSTKKSWEASATVLV
jgi:DNA-binding winged helix-turn-helix (wHTH) protein